MGISWLVVARLFWMSIVWVIGGRLIGYMCRSARWSVMRELRPFGCRMYRRGVTDALTGASLSWSIMYQSLASASFRLAIM